MFISCEEIEFCLTKFHSVTKGTSNALGPTDLFSGIYRSYLSCLIDFFMTQEQNSQTVNRFVKKQHFIWHVRMIFITVNVSSKRTSLSWRVRPITA